MHFDASRSSAGQLASQSLSQSVGRSVGLSVRLAGERSESTWSLPVGVALSGVEKNDTLKVDATLPTASASTCIFER